MEGPCLPQYAMGTDVINIYLYCLFFSTKHSSEMDVYRYFWELFYPLSFCKFDQRWAISSFPSLFLWEHRPFSISLRLVFPFSPILSNICSISVTFSFHCMYKCLQLQERVSKGFLVIRHPHFPQAIAFALWSTPYLLFIIITAQNV